MSKAFHKVAVVGAGWAGCAAAVELAAGGHQVTLFERARTLGGRARMVEIDGRRLDNGQHILLGAYRESLRLMRTVGIKESDAFLRLPLQMRYPHTEPGMDFLAPRLPAPLHMLVALLRAKGLSRDDKLALARFSTTARWMGWRLNQDCSVAELLDRFDQTDRLTRLMWRPLCIAALNTPPERASAQVFLNVLRDSLGAKRTASDMLIPRQDLSALFPQSAAAYIERHGGETRVGCAVQDIVPQAGGQTDSAWRLRFHHETREAEESFDAVIVATPAAQAAALLSGLEGSMPIPAFEHEPITTCYLQYPQHISLPAPLYALLEDEHAGHWGQFVFDRGQLMPDQAGLLAVVISTSGPAIKEGQEELTNAVAAQLAQALRMPELLQPQWSRIITEKRATFACTPALTRPASATGLEGLWLAGDYVAGDYPATLEGAVQSGMAAVRLLKLAD